MKEEVDRHLRRNYVLGIANGVLFMAGSSIFGPALILPQFLSTIFESNTLVGIGANLFRIGWALLQIVVAYFLRALKRRKPVYIIANTLRLGLVGLFILSLYLLQDNLRVVGVLFFIFVGLATLTAGPVGLAFQDIVARVIPSEKRGTFVAYRVLGGQGFTALGVGIVIRYVLARPEMFPYPTNYLVIFAMGWVLMVSGATAFSLIKEPPDNLSRPLPRFKSYFFELFLIVRRDRNFRRFLIVRALRICEALAIPFYIVFARVVLGVGPEAAGTFYIVGILTALPSSLLWGRAADRFGNRIVIITSCLVAMAAPLIALGLVTANAAGFPAAAEYSFQAAGVQLSVSATALTVGLVAPIFVSVHSAAVGGMIGLNHYVMDSAPPRRRPLYLGTSTSLMGLLMLIMPALGGATIDIVEKITGQAGYWVVFVVAAVALAMAAVFARGLYEPRKTVPWH